MTGPHIVVPHVSTPGVVTPGVVTPGVVAPYVAPLGRPVVTPNVAPSYAIGPAPATHNRDGAGPLQGLKSTFGGRFVHSGFVSEGGRHRPHLGWVLGFLGPVFWPYAYGDFIDYTFSPYAYDTFWPYAYDDVFDGIYGAYAPDRSDDASDFDHAAGGTAYVYGNELGAWVTPGRRSLRAATLAEGAGRICSGQTEGLTDFPIARIAQEVKPDQDQQPLLDDLKAVTAAAVEILRTACPSGLPSTPTGRLAAVRSRVEAMLQAVRVIDPTLQKLYRSLSDEQKERLNALDAEHRATAEDRQPDLTQLCGAAAQADNLPLAMIEQVLQLSDAQQTNLNALKGASLKAGDILKAGCPSQPTLTPTTRITHMKRRLEAMIHVLDTVQPALVNFYGSLDDEQKAQFNRFGVRAP
jgi:LTXXQ motif family protein